MKAIVLGALLLPTLNAQSATSTDAATADDGLAPLLIPGENAPTEAQISEAAANVGGEGVPFFEGTDPSDPSENQFGSNDVIIEPSTTPAEDFGAGAIPGPCVSFNGTGFTWPTADGDASPDDSVAEADRDAEEDFDLSIFGPDDSYDDPSADEADEAGIGAPPSDVDVDDTDVPSGLPTLLGFNFTSSNSTPVLQGVGTPVPLPSPISVDLSGSDEDEPTFEDEPVPESTPTYDEDDDEDSEPSDVPSEIPAGIFPPSLSTAPTGTPSVGGQSGVQAVDYYPEDGEGDSGYYGSESGGRGDYGAPPGDGEDYGPEPGEEEEECPRWCRDSDGWTKPPLCLRCRLQGAGLEREGLYEAVQSAGSAIRVCWSGDCVRPAVQRSDVYGGFGEAVVCV
ncbi:MAG: hypothetical protein I4N50_28705, partial [Rhizobium sp.]|nr:hypothetical protein [Rhizobium sp.]